MISSVDGNNLNKKTMNKKEIADLIKEAEHQQEGFHRVSSKISQDLINALKAAINYTHSCTELPIYMTCDEDDGQVFAAFTSNERCEIEAEESGTATQMTTLYFGERK